MWTAKDIEQIGKKKGVVKRDTPKTSTNNLTKQVIKTLWMLGWQAWRNNNGGVWDPTKKVFRANSVLKGVSDIIGFNKKTGQFIAVEIKTGRDKLSVEQKLFLDTLNESGGVGIEVRSIDDLIEKIKEIN